MTIINPINNRFGDSVTGFSMPTLDGTAGQVLTTNGAGVANWAAGGGGSFNAFSSYLTANIPNVTGDGTIYTVLFDTVQAQTGAAYNVATGIFTAPAAGYYVLSANLVIANVGNVLYTGLQAAFNVSGGAGIYNLSVCNPGAMFAQTVGIANEVAFGGAYVVFMGLGATAFVTVFVAGSTKTVGILGVANSTFSGALLF
jgi:hypothetical protein